uniref:Adhesion G protein-coupled receptor F3 n=1 Tax=Latimeria chalumnae TaxID=7897 RepID=H3AV35_LATCH
PKNQAPTADVLHSICTTQNTMQESRYRKGFLAVASDITSKQETLSKTTGDNVASTLMQAVETFSLLLQPSNESFEIVFPSIQMKGAMFGAENLKDYNKHFNMSLGVTLDINQSNFHEIPTNDTVIITSVAYANLAEILPTSSDTIINSLIHSTSVKLGKKQKKEVQISMTFEMKNKSANLQNAVCVYWNASLNGTGGWSKDGCQAKEQWNVTICNCSHLTTFGVLMSITPTKPEEPLQLITYLGLGVSIGSLCICIFIELLVWKSVTMSPISHFRHMSVVNMSVSLLAADLCFLTSAFEFKDIVLLCVAITFINHFFYLSLFFWSFCQSAILFHQLVFLFCHLRKKIYMSVSFLVGYIFPLAIALATLVHFYPKKKYILSNEDFVCWLNQDAIYAFIIPVGVIIFINFSILMVVIAKLMRPSVSDRSYCEHKNSAKNIVKAVLILTPAFGFTWALGFALHMQTSEDIKLVLNYAFAGLNAFQKLTETYICHSKLNLKKIKLTLI